MTSELALAEAVRVLRDEADALHAAAGRLDAGDIRRAVDLLVSCAGKVLLTGAGTSGIIASKIAATLTSTGTPSLFLHPADALHGGLGVVQAEDVVVAVSNSGETGELLVILPYLRHRSVRLIAILGNLDSTLAREADVVIDAVVDRETGPLGLAPTCSSTLALALGDALAMALMAAKDFTPDAFALNHPSGRLGRRLTLKVEDVVPGGLAAPRVPEQASLLDAIGEIGAGGVGAVSVVDAAGKVCGLVTDGDVRRAIQNGVTDMTATPVGQVMTKSPVSVNRGTLAYDALQRMEDRPTQISVLPVVESGGEYVGILRVHDLVRAGI